MPHSEIDKDYMDIALSLARRAIGTVSPNPAVACIIVKNNQIISSGITAEGGRPHAETIALAKAGDKASGATVYVTLEPCCHTGKTAPCTEALIKAGVRRVVIAAVDSYHKVNGGGIKQLEDAGIEVVTGVCEEQALEINAGFFSVHKNNRPYITVKIATSLDGKIATKSRDSKWITSEVSRRYAHLLRAQNDAIIVGSGTVIQDNPELTCRLLGLEKQSPIRVVLKGKTALSDDCKLFKSALETPVWVIGEGNNSNIEFINCDKNPDGQINLTKMLKTLADKGITRALVEGGEKVIKSFFESGLVDQFIWIRAPIIIGNDGIPAISSLGLETLGKTPHLRPCLSRKLGSDSLEIYNI